MPAEREEVQRELERAREQIAASAVALRREVAAKTDWKAYVRRQPVAWVLGAFVVGWLLGVRRS